MAPEIIDLSTWPRAAQFQFFRTYRRPHYATTVRLDVTHLMVRKAAGVSPYRACLFAVGVGIHAIPEFCLRFRENVVVRHPQVTLSMTVPMTSGGFGYGYLPFQAEFEAFDAQAKALIDTVAGGGQLDGNDGSRDDLAYLSCLPWLDYTSLNNALPGPDDCIPRISWGKFVDHGGRWDMAMTVEVHHALVDGQHVGAFFDHVQMALNSI
ncbi:MAG: CatA-like O-acetyltransferase [Pseudomonadota bacterium]